MKEVIRQSGFEAEDINSLSTGEVSKIIDSIGIVMPKVKKSLEQRSGIEAFGHDNAARPQTNLRQ